MDHLGAVIKTGIFKQPVNGRVRLGLLNLEGDAQADLENHGGIYKAVYAYPFEHYAYWKQQTRRTDLTPGQFGENLTVEGMLENEVYIGDVFQVGSAILEVTQPRTPCYKLGIKMGLPKFPRDFLSGGRVGFYLRVIQVGDIAAGDTFQCVGRDYEPMSVQEISHLKYFDLENLSEVKRALRIRALSPDWHSSFEARVGETKRTREQREGLKETAKH